MTSNSNNNKELNDVLLIRQRHVKLDQRTRRQMERLCEDRISRYKFEEVHCSLPSSVKSTFIMTFSPDGQRVASTHGDHRIYICDLNSGKLLDTLEGHPKTPWCLAWHPSNREILASGCLAGEVRVWDLKSKACESWTIENHSIITSLDFHPKERILMIASANDIHFWDWSESEPFAKTATLHEKEKVKYVAYDSSGTKLITGIFNLPKYAGYSSESLQNRIIDGYLPQVTIEPLPTENMTQNSEIATSPINGPIDTNENIVGRERSGNGDASATSSSSGEANCSNGNARCTQGAPPNACDASIQRNTVLMSRVAHLYRQLESLEDSMRNPSFSPYVNLQSANNGSTTSSDRIATTKRKVSESSVDDGKRQKLSSENRATGDAPIETDEPSGRATRGGGGIGCIGCGGGSSGGGCSSSGSGAGAGAGTGNLDAGIGTQNNDSQAAPDRQQQSPARQGLSPERMVLWNGPQNPIDQSLQRLVVATSSGMPNSPILVRVYNRLPSGVSPTSPYVQPGGIFEAHIEQRAGQIESRRRALSQDNSLSPQESTEVPASAEVPAARGRVSVRAPPAIQVLPPGSNNHNPVISGATLEAWQRLPHVHVYQTRGSGNHLWFNHLTIPLPYTSSNFRLQCWNFSRESVPNIKDSQSNVVTQKCRIHNDASIDISSNGSLVACLVPRDESCSFPNLDLKIFSLRSCDFGACYYKLSQGPNAVSVSLSPSATYAIVGLASHKILSADQAEDSVTIAKVYRMDQEIEHVRDVKVKRDDTLLSLNAIKWLPRGIVYNVGPQHHQRYYTSRVRNVVAS